MMKLRTLTMLQRQARCIRHRSAGHSPLEARGVLRSAAKANRYFWIHCSKFCRQVAFNDRLHKGRRP